MNNWIKVVREAKQKLQTEDSVVVEVEKFSHYVGLKRRAEKFGLRAKMRGETVVLTKE